MSGYNSAAPAGSALAMLLKPLDTGIIIPALGAVIFSFFFAYAGGGDHPLFSIKTAGAEWVFPADASEKIAVPGPLGDTVIEIHDHAARIVSSPCANQSCVAAGAIRQSGQWAACLPNQVVLFIGSGKFEKDIDAAAW